MRPYNPMHTILSQHLPKVGVVHYHAIAMRHYTFIASSVIITIIIVIIIILFSHMISSQPSLKVR